MSYIDHLAHYIGLRCDCEWMPLLRIYAVLALTVGEEVTNANVHDAWASWMATVSPAHPSLVPFGELPRETQALDEPYRQAIVAAAQWMRGRP